MNYKKEMAKNGLTWVDILDYGWFECLVFDAFFLENLDEIAEQLWAIREKLT